MKHVCMHKAVNDKLGGCSVVAWPIVFLVTRRGLSLPILVLHILRSPWPAII